MKTKGLNTHISISAFRNTPCFTGSHGWGGKEMSNKTKREAQRDAPVRSVNDSLRASVCVVCVSKTERLLVREWLRLRVYMRD